MTVAFKTTFEVFTRVGAGRDSHHFRVIQSLELTVGKDSKLMVLSMRSAKRET
jgi:hypothetical protein